MEDRTTPAKRRDAERAEIEARERDLYGVYLDDVGVLRRRSFVVVALQGGAFVVGNKIVDGAGLRALADRERRLMGRSVAGLVVRQVEASASGLTVGHVEAYQAPKLRELLLRPRLTKNQ